jgi:hypothetical protein
VSFARSAFVFLDGMSRCAKERYRVHLLDQTTGASRAVESPRGSYYADPFVFCEGAERWLFVEAFHCPTNRGYIAAVPIGDALRVGRAVRALDTGGHASFPYVFTYGGAIYMLPETSRAGRVELYVCDSLPDRWRPAATLLDRVDCADSVLHRRGNVWYLVTSQSDERTSPRRWLAIYCSDSLLSGRWTPHPVNRERRYAGRPHGYGRNAGGMLDAGGDVLRPMQSSTGYYGQSASVMRVVELTPERYEESPYDGDHVVSRIAAAHSTHHVSVSGGLVAWDTRTRAGYFRGTA